MVNMHIFAAVVLATKAASALHLPEQQQVLAASPKEYSLQTPPLDTDWTHKVGTDPWPQYPRPKLVRSRWQSLNGIWTYSNAASQDLSDPPFNCTLSQEVLVPFCLESGLSGIQAANPTHSWYRTSFKVPREWTKADDRVILNFGAVDYEATVFVNGQNVTFHRGGYSAFSVDITEHLSRKNNELIVFAFDPTDSDGHVVPVGKQTLTPSHIWYRPCSGIWQSVWLESVPRHYVGDLIISGDATGQVNLTVGTTKGKPSHVEVIVSDKTSKKVLATHSGFTESPIVFNVQTPKPWSPETPTLYDVTIKMDQDIVGSYVGFRTIGRASVNGVQRIMLNGEPIFTFGTLDQGYWPDGLYTAPTYEAMTYDIKTLKRLGHNMLRKHVKVEPALYYAAADELGILIMQDMPNLGHPHTVMPNAAQQAEFERQLEIMVTQLRNHESIFAWEIYNEGWGQITSYYPEFALTSRLQTLDPTRLINSVSGWHSHGAGDFSDNHHYVSPQCGTPWSSGRTDPFNSSRIGFQGEFAGLGHNVSAEHLWKVPQAVDGIKETYELYTELSQWNDRAHVLLSELLLQVQLHSCSGAVWTGSTDVEGEVNGMMTYDRRLVRPDIETWKADIQALYNATAYRANNSIMEFPKTARGGIDLKK